jgi:valyl-tRNA synthetase
MSSSQDVRFSEEKIAQGQALVNKLFNATRFALLQIGEEELASEARPRTVEDRWILSRLEAAQAAMRERVDAFDFSKVALGLYDFVYGELCDWYLEMVKPRLYAEDDPEGRADLAATLRHVLRETLLLAHPVIPFVTEELWGMLGEEGLLAEAHAPPAAASARDASAEADVERAIAAVTALRGWRDRCEVRPGAVVPVRLPASGYEATGGTIANLARVSYDGDAGPPVAGLAIPGGTIDILASPDVDLEAAERRLESRRKELRAEIDRAERKLGNEGFVAKAPPQVVDAEREKLARYRAELEGL